MKELQELQDAFSALSARLTDALIALRDKEPPQRAMGFEWHRNNLRSLADNLNSIDGFSYSAESLNNLFP